MNYVPTLDLSRAPKVSMGDLIPGTPEYRRETYRRTKMRKEADPNRFINDLFLDCKNKAPQRGIDFNLSLEMIHCVFIYQNWICAGSGRNLSVKTGDPNRASIDRIDSNRGYEIDNIQIVTAAYNQMKNDRTQEFTDALILDCARVITRKAKA